MRSKFFDKIFGKFKFRNENLIYGAQQDLAAPNSNNAFNMLIAEDNQVDFATLNRAIKTITFKQNVTIKHASNPNTILQASAKEKFNLIFMDITYLGHAQNGFELSQYIRKNTINASTPIIASTTETADKCYDAGMNGYLSKPYQRNKIANIINGYMTAS